MDEEEALHFAMLHFEGVDLEWWHHKMISQGYLGIATFDEFA